MDVMHFGDGLRELGFGCGIVVALVVLVLVLPAAVRGRKGPRGPGRPES